MAKPLFTKYPRRETYGKDTFLSLSIAKDLLIGQDHPRFILFDGWIRDIYHLLL
jgi:hypothetical protein